MSPDPNDSDPVSSTDAASAAAFAAHGGWPVVLGELTAGRHLTSEQAHAAMQQILEDDPWMDDPRWDGDDVLAAADAGDGADW